MFKLAANKTSLDRLTRYELILNHCFEKLGASDIRWHHSDAFSAAIDYARKSGYLNARNELTALGHNFANLKQLDLDEAA